MPKKAPEEVAERSPEAPASGAEYEFRIDLAIGLGGSHDRYFIRPGSPQHDVETAFAHGIEWALERTGKRLERENPARSGEVEGWVKSALEPEDRRRWLVSLFREGRFTNYPRKRVFYVGDDKVLLSEPG